MKLFVKIIECHFHGRLSHTPFDLLTGPPSLIRSHRGNSEHELPEEISGSWQRDHRPWGSLPARFVYLVLYAIFKVFPSPTINVCIKRLLWFLKYPTTFSNVPANLRSIVYRAKMVDPDASSVRLVPQTKYQLPPTA